MSGGDSVRLMLMRATCTSPHSSELSERMTRQGLGRGPGDSASSPELCLGTGPQSWVGYSQRRAKIVLGKKRSLFFFSLLHFEFLAEARTDYQRKGGWINRM